jgi:hypothetical protein
MAVGYYLKIAKKARTRRACEPGPGAPNARRQPATKATKGPALCGNSEKTSRDKSDLSEKRAPSFVLLTVSEVEAEMKRRGSGAGKNAELYRRGALSREKAIEYITCAVLHWRGAPFEGWRRHAPAVEAALTLPAVIEVAPKEGG